MDNNSWVESINYGIYASKRTRCNETVNNDNKLSIISQVESENCNKVMIEKSKVQSPGVLPIQSPHVHPKLLKYDNLVAKFKDLKRENMYKNSTNHCSFSK